MSFAAAVPVARRHIQAARALAAAARQASGAADRLADALDALPQRLEDGRLDLEAVRRATKILDGVTRDMRAAERTTRRAPSTWLLPQAARLRRQAVARLEAGARTIGVAANGLRVVPAMLGGSGRRTYFLAFANLAEMRGSGGFIGSYGVIRASGGRVELGEIGRPTGELPPPDYTTLTLPDWYAGAYARRGGTSIWQSVNVTSDFPTVGDLIAQTLARPGSIGPVDGVVQIDPLGLRALLLLTGPVTVRGWPTPIGPDDVSRVTQHEAYVRFGDDHAARITFLETLTKTIFARAVQDALDLRPAALLELGRTVSAGHVQVWARRTDEQDVLRRAGLTGDVARTAGATDVLGLVTENWTPSKADWFLTRELSYDVTVDANTRAATGRLRVGLHSDAPPDGLPQFVIGPTDEVAKGWNRLLTVYLRPPRDQLHATSVDGHDRPVTRDNESVLRSYSQFVLVPPKGTTLLQARFSATDAVRGSGRHRSYRLHVLRQPVVNPDRLDARISVPKGWRIDGPTRWRGTVQGDVILDVRLTQSRRAWLYDTLLLQPARTARALLDRVV